MFFIPSTARYRVIRYSFGDMEISHSKCFRTLTAARIYFHTLASLKDSGVLYGLLIMVVRL